MLFGVVKGADALRATDALFVVPDFAVSGSGTVFPSLRLMISLLGIVDFS